MPASIFSNDIPIPDRRKVIGAAVLDGIGNRPENWVVSIHEPQYSPDYVVTIEGPDNFKWTHRFSGNELTPEFIRNAVGQAVAAVRQE